MFIEAQTGRGKNHFIMNCLVPFAIRMQRRVIYICNRVVLSIQQKKELLKTLNMPNIYSNEELYNLEDFGLIQIFNYQKLKTFYGENYDASKDSYFFQQGYLILDECHYFMSDALFNSYTWLEFSTLLSTRFTNYVHIYMSASPENIFDHISNLEINYNLSQQYATLCDLKNKNVAKDAYATYAYVLYYKFKYDYSKYNFYFFNDYKTIEDRLKTASDKDKWLCFINDSKKGRLLASIDKNISFIDRKAKDNSNAWNEILQGNIYGHALIATSVIDNGVNITDSNLKHIVLVFTDQISLKQMMGRKRKAPNEEVDIYFYVENEDKIKRIILKIKEKLDLICIFKNLNFLDFLELYWDKLTPELMRLFYFKDKILMLNNFAEYELLYQYSWYSNILFRMQQANQENLHNVIPQIILEIFDKSQLPITWLNEENDESLKNELLTLIEQGPTPKENIDSFYKKFIDIADNILIPKKDFKNNNNSKPATINNHLKRLNLPYKVMKRSNF